METPDKPRDEWTDEEFIARFGEDAKKVPWPKRLGRLKRPGWRKTIAVYLIWCERCSLTRAGGFTVAHPAGYEKRLECKHCRRRYDQHLPSRRVKDVILNPHRHPWFLLFLILLVIMFARAASH